MSTASQHRRAVATKRAEETIDGKRGEKRGIADREAVYCPGKRQGKRVHARKAGRPPVTASPAGTPPKPKRQRKKTGDGMHALARARPGPLPYAERDARRHTPADLERARAEGYAAGVEGYHAAILGFFRRAWSDYPIEPAAQTALRRALYTLAARQIERAQTG
jgi:ribosome modulation factor